MSGGPPHLRLVRDVTRMVGCHVAALKHKFCAFFFFNTFVRRVKKRSTCQARSAKTALIDSTLKKNAGS